MTNQATCRWVVGQLDDVLRWLHKVVACVSLTFTLLRNAAQAAMVSTQKVLQSGTGSAVIQPVSVIRSSATRHQVSQPRIKMWWGRSNTLSDLNPHSHLPKCSCNLIILFTNNKNCNKVLKVGTFENVYFSNNLSIHREPLLMNWYPNFYKFLTTCYLSLHLSRKLQEMSRILDAVSSRYQKLEF